ncbi:hypothetical protein J0871_16470 [Salegentibacter sp. BDJ18]|uniref:hypothetical protein n=1 Tax=Salegentibacter sp. BDJ18 TaxID=2816376 RepID=UPI001AAF5CD5|nr:hypothetical protein [Salegentibacter sp. BDJ18]MBO2546013.1 hypothetical protein [Salegentibacter sp. BDJ18]
MEEEYIELKREGDRIEVLELMKSQYPFYVNPEFLSLKIYQTKDCVFLEKIYKSKPSEVINEPLNSISDFFDPNDSLEKNAIDFVFELGEYTIMMTFEDVFTEEVAQEIINNAHSEEEE